MEDFVPFKIAETLKEKGFMERCLAYYDVDDNVGLLYNTQYTDEILPCQYEDLLQCHNTEEAETQSDDSGNCVDAPTISQVLKWLRVEYKIYMYVERDTYHLKFRFVYEKDKPRGKFTSSIYDGFEQAALAGIEYVLNNILK